MVKIAVLIPCYNEAQTIEKVVRDYKRELPEAEIFVYDNNSTDGTDEIARKAGATVVYERRQGKGNVIRSMFRDIDAQCYLMVDGDDTYSASSAREMTDLVLEQGVDMVIGDRLSSTYFTENTRPFHSMGNRMVRFLINRLFKSNVRDIMTGYRAMGKRFVKTFPVLSKGFEIETEMTIHALDKNFILDEVMVEYKERAEGSVSKLHTFLDGRKVLKTILSLFCEYRPLAFYGGLFVFTKVVGWSFFFFGRMAEMKHPSMRIWTYLGAMNVTLGHLMLGCAFITCRINKKQKQDYELLLNMMAKGEEW